MSIQRHWLDTYDEDYPETDGAPMAESTDQFDWIVRIKENLEILFTKRDDVFVAGDLFWYPERSMNASIRAAPDAMVVLGRPKGPRRCYKQWQEDNIGPQVVFEVRSHSNTARDMRQKLAFYDRYAVQEYYVYDPQRNKLEIYQRGDKGLVRAAHIGDWVSPLLQIRFSMKPGTLEVYYPDGTPFRSPVELAWQTEQLQQQAEQLQQQAARMAERLRSLGIDPDTL